MESILSDFENVQDDSSFDDQQAFLEDAQDCAAIVRPKSRDEQKQSLPESPLAFGFLENGDDSYFTEGFVSVGQLLGAF